MSGGVQQPGGAGGINRGSGVERLESEAAPEGELELPEAVQDMLPDSPSARPRSSGFSHSILEERLQQAMRERAAGGAAPKAAPAGVERAKDLERGIAELTLAPGERPTLEWARKYAEFQRGPRQELVGLSGKSASPEQLAELKGVIGTFAADGKLDDLVRFLGPGGAKQLQVALELNGDALGADTVKSFQSACARVHGAPGALPAAQIPAKGAEVAGLLRARLASGKDASDIIGGLTRPLAKKDASPADIQRLEDTLSELRKDPGFEKLIRGLKPDARATLAAYESFHGTDDELGVDLAIAENQVAEADMRARGSVRTD